eukprot:augustus_masked-scaffold_8-processed-gene-9.11-mRNA-1 protein AED:0.23 eAED:0.24 QI:0/-1/0/1/-1/1/1/0/536
MIDHSLIDDEITFYADQDPSNKKSLNLDYRIIKPLLKQSITMPTVIQTQTIPIALKGKDILLRSKTGTGKTLAYLLPILQNLLSNSSNSVQCVILLPTSELAHQVANLVSLLLSYASEIITFQNLTSPKFSQAKKLLLQNPNVILSTPGRLLKLLESLPKFTLKSTLRYLVLDEADLLLEYNFKDDLTSLIDKHIPKSTQNFLISATLPTQSSSMTQNLAFLKSLVLSNPTILTLDASSENSFSFNNLNQLYLTVKNQEEKDILVYAIFKLNLIRPKTLIFVNDVNSAYRTSMLLEHFCVPRVGILNPLLPVNNRLAKLDLFNKGLVDVLITCKGSSEEDEFFDISRGIDLQDISYVVNLEAPGSVDEYVHRVGRAGRGGMVGSSLSIFQTDKNAEVSLLDEIKEMKELDLKLLELNMEDLAGLRYRVKDVRNRITPRRVKTLKEKEIRLELLTSEKVKQHFKSHPNDFHFLTAANETKLTNLSVKKVNDSLSTIPDYLLGEEIGKSAKIRIKRKLPAKLRKKQRWKKRKSTNPLS